MLCALLINHAHDLPWHLAHILQQQRAIHFAIAAEAVKKLREDAVHGALALYLKHARLLAVCQAQHFWRYAGHLTNSGHSLIHQIYQPSRNAR